MRLSTWNVNGIRAREKALLAWLAEHAPDILVLQEVKAALAQVPATITKHQDYCAYWNDSTTKAGYSGVAVLVRKPFLDLHGEPHMRIPDFDVENRLLELDFGAFILIGGYFPRGEKPEHYALKLRFFDALREFSADTLRAGKNLLIAGDINVAREAIDLHPSQQKDDAIGFRPDERRALNALLSVGLHDVFRELHPQQSGLYTWFPYWKGARERNIGWRIDCVYASPRLAALAKSGIIHADEKSSDHYPLSIEFDLP